MRMCSRTTSPLPLTSHNGHREYCSLEKYIHGDVLDSVCHVKNNLLAAQVFINWTKILISSVCYILFSYHISSPPASIYHFSPSDFSLTRGVCSSSAHSSFPPPLYSHMALSFFLFFLVTWLLSLHFIQISAQMSSIQRNLACRLLWSSTFFPSTILSFYPALFLIIVLTTTNFSFSFTFIFLGNSWGILYVCFCFFGAICLPQDH